MRPSVIRNAICDCCFMVTWDGDAALALTESKSVVKRQLATATRDINIPSFRSVIGLPFAFLGKLWE
jgi:hypothetical protein